MRDKIDVGAFFDELGEIEKVAISPFLLGPLLHVGMNSLYKGFRSLPAGHSFEAGQLASGFRHGMAGQKLHPVTRNVATYGIGPESLANYDIGRVMGESMSGLSKGRRYRELKKLRKSVAMSQHVREAPLGRSVVPAVNRILGGQQGVMERLSTVPAQAKPTLGQNLISAGIGGAAVAAAPDTAVHMGINALRKRVATSRFGRRFFKKQFVQGLQQGPIRRAAALGSDLGISPAALDTRRLGAAMRQEAVSNPALAKRLSKSVGGQALSNPLAQATLNRLAQARGVGQDLLEKGQLALRRAGSALIR